MSKKFKLGQETVRVLELGDGAEYIVGHVLQILDCVSVAGDDNGKKLDAIKTNVKKTIYSQLHSLSNSYGREEFDKFKREECIELGSD